MKKWALGKAAMWGAAAGFLVGIWHGVQDGFDPARIAGAVVGCVLLFVVVAAIRNITVKAG